MVQAIVELRHEFDLSLLLACSKMAKSSFYYYLKRSKTDKYLEIKILIIKIYHKHKGRYCYRRITTELNKNGHLINHKTVFRLMKLLGLKSLIRGKKYRSYKGSIGKIAANLLDRKFKSIAPNQKWITDITEFKLGNQKLYLSPILDLYNQEIISYQLSERPVFNQVTNMLKKAFKRLAIPNETISIFIKRKRGYSKYESKRKLFG